MISGISYTEEVISELDPQGSIHWLVNEGDHIGANSQLAGFRGPALALLTGGRTALNFIQMLSAVASRTRELATLVKKTQAQIFDKRKTIPGLHDAHKCVVKVGGGENHRIGLFDQILINHIASAGGFTQAIQATRQMHPTIKVQIEAETFAELEEAFNA